MMSLTTYRVDSGNIIIDPTGLRDGDTTTWIYHDATVRKTKEGLPQGQLEIRMKSIITWALDDIDYLDGAQIRA